MSNQTTQKEVTFFEKQRDLLIQEIGLSMDTILNNINTLNRSLENSVAVGKEFDSVSQLWANFYDGMAQIDSHAESKGPDAKNQAKTQENSILEDE